MNTERILRTTEAEEPEIKGPARAAHHSFIEKVRAFLEE
jgi:hypothetical protein